MNWFIELIYLKGKCRAANSAADASQATLDGQEANNNSSDKRSYTLFRSWAVFGSALV